MKSSSTAAVWGLSDEVRSARSHQSDPSLASPLHLFSLEEGIGGQDREGKEGKEKTLRLKAAAGRWGKRTFDKIPWVNGVWDKCAFKMPEEPSAAGRVAAAAQAQTLLQTLQVGWYGISYLKQLTFGNIYLFTGCCVPVSRFTFCSCCSSCVWADVIYDLIS